jgi:hypothetical protein
MPASAMRKRPPTLPSPNPEPKARVSVPRRIGQLARRPADHTWVEGRVAEAILQVSRTQVTRLAEKGALRFERGLFNLADILERYKQLLRTAGAVDEKVEAVCVRAFEEGLLPQDVIIKFSFGIQPVHEAWKAWGALRADPSIAEKLLEREKKAARESHERCATCRRAPEVAVRDTNFVVREVTGDPARESFAIAEERAFADLDVRCPTCRALKVRAPIEAMRARVLALRTSGEPATDESGAR